MLYSCCQELEVVPQTSRVVRSAQHTDLDVELSANIGMNMNYNAGTMSETGVDAEGWQKLGSQWIPRQSQSDTGVDMGIQAHGRVSDHRAMPMAGVQEERKADKQEQENV